MEALRFTLAMRAELCGSGTFEAWSDAGCLQGVRIDYALCSSGLLKHVVSCEILSLPPKWSDHAALVLGEFDAASYAVPIPIQHCLHAMLYGCCMTALADTLSCLIMWSEFCLYYQHDLITTNLPIYLPTHPTHPPAYLPTYLPT